MIERDNRYFFDFLKQIKSFTKFALMPSLKITLINLQQKAYKLTFLIVILEV